MNAYLELTEEFNSGKVRAIVSSGQAVVLHRLAVMSKDGDWIIREEGETTAHILSVLASHGARYRFGAPLDCRWLKEGWSSHFEFFRDGLRIRTDFVSRPPRINREALDRLWKTHESQPVPFVGLRDLAELKKTNREKDYPVIGELARLMGKLEERLLYSRSARDLIALAAQYPGEIGPLKRQRPLLAVLSRGEDAVEKALDEERRELMHRNEERLQKYIKAAEHWKAHWPALDAQTAGLGLLKAHETLVKAAENDLPAQVEKTA